jgi:hypothetical protein
MSRACSQQVLLVAGRFSATDPRTEVLLWRTAVSGDSLDTASHPAACAAAAASAAAAGDDNASDYHLDAADALARVWLDTDLLGGSRPGEPRTT